MNQRKTNRSLWYSMALAVLLCIAFLVVATGTTLARYRLERDANLTFEARPPEQIALGTEREITAEEATADLLIGTKVFDPTQQAEWEKTDSGYQMTLAVANGISDTEFSARDQRITLRLAGTIGMTVENQTQTSEDPETVAEGETQAGEEALTISLILPPETGETEATTLKATHTPIIPGTPLHTKMGDGLIFTFQDAEGKEPYWELPGGKLSYVTITLTMEGEKASADALLVQQVIAEVIGE